MTNRIKSELFRRDFLTAKDEHSDARHCKIVDSFLRADAIDFKSLELGSFSTKRLRRTINATNESMLSKSFLDSSSARSLSINVNFDHNVCNC